MPRFSFVSGAFEEKLQRRQSTVFESVHLASSHSEILLRFLGFTQSPVSRHGETLEQVLTRNSGSGIRDPRSLSLEPQEVIHSRTRACEVLPRCLRSPTKHQPLSIRTIMEWFHPIHAADSRQGEAAAGCSM